MRHDASRQDMAGRDSRHAVSRTRQSDRSSLLISSGSNHVFRTVTYVTVVAPAVDRACAGTVLQLRRS